MTLDPDDPRGVLYPARLPSFHREAAPDVLRELVRWFWIPQWNLPPGETSRQQLLPFPATNLVVAPEGVTLAGPTSGASYRDLKGHGWAVGALFRPAGVASIGCDPHEIHDQEVLFKAPELHRSVVTAMTEEKETAMSQSGAPQKAVRAYSDWLSQRLAPPDDGGLMANAMEDLISSDRSIIRAEQVADRLHVSLRGVQRLAQRYVGLPPLAMIRRYRLQEAAQRLREDPTLTIAQTAAELGYADQAHLSSDFRHVFGFNPTEYRRQHRDAT
ncbi:MAG TPA: helix-turn-helix domain-containing protein [Candidatus Nesterenkonia stercoripullorum]|uniref:Helix-turn-helix domain-containing protein n=1 Tax=Candidatus Nesterenkonia stercoripullorum TaxID=2838701 RepID=A0A9D1UUF5_9MICC|nr:helix-turn-helix domain-containing protein [Candidatus Nesterenkonia stercoripullorum]